MTEYPWAWGWEAVSAIATGVATVVALGLPFLMDFLAKRRAKFERRDSVREILHAVDAALAHHRDMVRAVPPGGRLPYVMADLSAKADLTQATLHVLIARPGLTDGVISAGLGAAQLATGIAEIALGRGMIEPWRAGATALAAQVKERAEGVRKSYGIVAAAPPAA